MEYMVIIPGKLPGLNQWIDAMNRNRFEGAKMKKSAQHKVEQHLAKQLRDHKIHPPVKIHYIFWEPDKRRDHDNVSGFAHKVIQDAMVNIGALKNDGWNHISGYSDDFFVDRLYPRIEIIIEEVD